MHSPFENSALHNQGANAYIAVIEFSGAAALGKHELIGDEMNVARSFSNWRKYRQTCRELARMSDRELRDIGVHRADIERIARTTI